MKAKDDMLAEWGLELGALRAENTALRARVDYLLNIIAVCTAPLDETSFRLEIRAQAWFELRSDMDSAFAAREVEL